MTSPSAAASPPDVPEPRKVVDLTMADGAVIRVRRHGDPSGPRLVLCHGNGFAIDGYMKFWSRLLPRYDVILFDLRNHGQNPRHKQEAHGILSFASDHLAVQQGVAQAFGAKPTAAIFHSVSGIGAIVSSGLHGLRYDALVLVDPPLVQPEGAPLHAATHAMDSPLAQWARQRQGVFDSIEELAAHFTKARAFQRWEPGAALDMARATLRPSGDGKFVLSCPGPWEAQVYMQNRDLGAWRHLPSLKGKGPVLFLGADPDLADARPPGKTAIIAAREAEARHAAIPDTGHMLQIEKPDETIKVIEAFLAYARLL